MKKFALLALAGVSLTSLSSAIQAQDARGNTAEESAETADDSVIIVNARRRDERLQDVPISVQAVDGDNLHKLEIRRFQDLGAIVPGTSFSRGANGVQNTVTMRGIAFNSTGTGPQAAVELYRNDVVTSSSAVFQALYDVGQIEVLRGPQGTLRGRASPSGSITIYTRRPDLNEVGGYASGLVTGRSNWNAEFALNVPVVSDMLAVRVAGFASRDHGSNVDRIEPRTRAIDDNVFDEIHSLRASVRANPFDDMLILDFNYETTQRKARQFLQAESRNFVDGGTVATPFSQTISSRDRLAIGVLPNNFDGTYKFYNWQAQLNLFGQSLTYVGGRLDAASVSTSPDDPVGILANPVATSAAVNPPQNINEFAQLTNSVQQQRFHEIRLQSSERIAGIFDYVVGYMYLRSNTPTELYTTTSACVGGGANCAVGGLSSVTLGGTYRSRTDRENSIFGNITAHLGERTEISAGIRQITFDRVAGLQSTARNGLGQILTDREAMSVIRTYAPAAAFAIDDSVKHSIYTLSASHRFTDSLMAYASYGTSFRPGNVLVCAQCVTAAEGAFLINNGYLKMQDETSDSYEFGIKSSWFDDRLTLNLSAFRQQFNNFTILSPEPVQYLSSYTPAVGNTPATGTFGSRGATQNLALVNAVKVVGFEAEVGLRLSDHFNIGGVMAYARSSVSNGRVPCVDMNDDNFQDATQASLAAFVANVGANLVDTCAISRATAAPKWSASVQGEYSLPMSDHMDGYLRSLVSWRGNTGGEAANPRDSVRGFATVNMYAGIRGADGNWELSVFARNLTNVHRVLTRDGSRIASTIARVSYPSDFYRITTNAPREFGLSLRVAFGSR